MTQLKTSPDAQINAVECQNLSLEERNIIQKKGIIAETCAKISSLARAAILSSGVLLSANAMANDQDTSNILPQEVAQNMTQSERSAYFFNELKRLGVDITSEDIVRVLSAQEFEVFAKEEALVTLKDLGLDTPFTQENISQKLTQLLQSANIAEQTQKNWQERIAELSPNDDEATLLNRVVSSIPADQMTPSKVVATLTSTLSLHKILQDQKFDDVKKLNLLTDVHNILRGLGVDTTNHVRLYLKQVDGKELSYTLFLPTEVSHLAQVSYSTGLDITPAFQELIEQSQAEFVTKAKELLPKGIAMGVDNIEKDGLTSDWYMLTEVANIGYKNMSEFVQAFQSLSPEDQKDFFTSISSGNTPAHQAYLKLNLPQKEFVASPEWKGKLETQENRVLSSTVSLVASLGANARVLSGENPRPRSIERVIPTAKELGISYQDYETLALAAEDFNKMNAEQQAQRIAQIQAERQKIQESIEQTRQRIAQADERIAQADERIAYLNAQNLAIRIKIADKLGVE